MLTASTAICMVQIVKWEQKLLQVCRNMMVCCRQMSITMTEKLKSLFFWLRFLD